MNGTEHDFRNIKLVGLIPDLEPIPLPGRCDVLVSVGLTLAVDLRVTGHGARSEGERCLLRSYPDRLEIIALRPRDCHRCRVVKTKAKVAALTGALVAC